MSTHTLIHTRFHNMNDLVGVLNRSGILTWPWISDGSHAAVGALVNGEVVWFVQQSVGEPVVIQSSGRYFQNTDTLNQIADAETEYEAQQRSAEQQQHHKEARRAAEAARLRAEEAEQRRIEAIRQAKIEAIRQAKIEEQRRREEEARRAAEEAEQLRLEAIARKAELEQIEQDSARILSRMSELESRSFQAPPPPAATPEPLPPNAPPTMSDSDANLLLGRLVQQHAEARVLEVLEALETSHGIQFDHRRVGEDNTIEIVLRG